MDEPTWAENDADEIAAIFREEAAPLFAQFFHADRYELVALDKGTDGRGGRTVTETIVERGRCSLSITEKGGLVRNLGGELFYSVSPFSVEMPRDSIVTSDHILRIVGRGDFLIIGTPKLGGDADMFTVLDLEQRQ